jgi:hypothetical protein
MWGHLRWLRRAPLAIIILVSTLLGTASAELPMAEPPAAHFGPRLYLLLPAEDEPLATLPPTVVLHAQLHVERGAHYLLTYVASGGVDDLLTMAEAGLAVRVLDEDTSDKVYYFADSTAPMIADLAPTVGQVLYADPLVTLIGLPTADEERLLDTLLAQGIPVAALTADPLNLQRADTLVASQDAAAQSVGANPVIAGLLNGVTERELGRLIGELSGETPVSVSGATVTLQTRFTLSTQMRTVEEYLYQYYQTLGLTPSFAPWTYGRYSGRNVVVEIPGVQRPERVWLVGGHFDAISENSYTSAPGADDNASGIAATMLIGALLRNYQFADTIRLIHFSGEEQGQWGSKRYAAAQNQADAQILGYLNLDMIGYDGNGDRKVEVHTGLGANSNALGAAFIDNNLAYGQGLLIERKTTSASRFSDHAPFWDHGYPAVLVIEDFFDNARPGDRDRNPHYHRTGDKRNLVDLGYVARTTRVALATLAELAVLQATDPNATPTASPSHTPTLTPTLSPTPVPQGCLNLVLNGDFEGNTAWQFGSTPYPAAYVNTVSLAGGRAIRLGVPPPATNRMTHSSAFQRITIPATASTVILRFWERPGGGADGVDYRETLLLDRNYRFLKLLSRTTAINAADQWNERTFDLSSYRGQSVVIYFNVYNNGSGGQQWNYIDSAEVLTCGPNLPTATPTFTPTPTRGVSVRVTPPIQETAPPPLPPRIYLPVVQP